MACWLLSPLAPHHQPELLYPDAAMPDGASLRGRPRDTSQWASLENNAVAHLIALHTSHNRGL